MGWIIDTKCVFTIFLRNNYHLALLSSIHLILNKEVKCDTLAKADSQSDSLFLHL